MTDINISCLAVAPLDANCCVVKGEQACFVIDPGGDADRIITQIGSHRLEAILLTHAHYDHIGGAGDLLKAYPDATLMSSEETARRVDDPRLNFSPMIVGRVARIPSVTQHLQDGVSFTTAGIEVTPHSVPGHEPGEMVFYLPSAGVLFSGDTVFAGGIGRSDLDGGDARALVDSLRSLLRRLPEETVIYPGHGPSTTVKQERQNNMYLNGTMT